MANPIRPHGRSGMDIFEEAARQDEERQIQEDDAHFSLTGINRRPRRLDNPLVDNNPSPDIANDGDEYDENNITELRNGINDYVENDPSEFINLPSQNSRRSNNPTRERVMDAYNKRETEKEEKEFNLIKEKRIEKSKNAIMELKIDEED